MHLKETHILEIPTTEAPVLRVQEDKFQFCQHPFNQKLVITNIVYLHLDFM